MDEKEKCALADTPWVDHNNPSNWYSECSLYRVSSNKCAFCEQTVCNKHLHTCVMKLVTHDEPSVLFVCDACIIYNKILCQYMPKTRLEALQEIHGGVRTKTCEHD